MKREMSHEKLDVLWHEMGQDKDAFGHPGGCPFADAFFQRAKSCTADCWRKAGPEIVYDMLGELKKISGFEELTWHTENQSIVLKLEIKNPNYSAN